MGVLARSLLVTFVAFLAAVNAISTISVAGSKFFTNDGKQWFVKGQKLSFDFNMKLC